MATERYHPLVAADLRDACRHHDEIAEALGNRFRKQVQSKIEAVLARPKSFGRIGGDFRGALMARFPYVVVFAVENGVPYIYGLRHAASDQKTWFDRTMTEADG